MSVSKEELEQIIRRIEKLEEEKRTIQDDIKEIYKNASNDGFYPNIIKQIVKMRRMDKLKLEQEEEILDLYRNIIGI